MKFEKLAFWNVAYYVFRAHYMFPYSKCLMSNEHKDKLALLFQGTAYLVEDVVDLVCQVCCVERWLNYCCIGYHINECKMVVSINYGQQYNRKIFSIN